MSEKVIVLGKGISKASSSSSVQGYESAWLGRWTQFHDGESKGIVRPPQGKKFVQEDVGVLPFPMFKKRESSTKLDVGSSSKAIANRMPRIYAQGDGSGFSILEKTTQNLLELVRPVRFYATVEEGGHHQILKGSMKLKGKIIGGYLDLFPNKGGGGEGGVRLQSLDSSKDSEEEIMPTRKNESSAETKTLEMMHLSGSISSSSTKVLNGKEIKGGSVIHRTEIPDMNEEPPVVVEETSNSATQSMNVDNFLSRELLKRALLEPEPSSSRWVKRLKTNNSDETKSMMKIEQGNNNNLFLEILKSGINNLKPRNLNRGGGGGGGGEEDITVLHPWIQRWCKKKDKSTDQQGGEQEKKHYPSIAAMALMGKALSGLNPYGLRKTESLMVWNARDLR